MTTISGKATATIASFVFPQDKSFNLDISSLAPGSENQKSVEFSVVNYEVGTDDKVTAISEVSQKYEIVITTTNRLPLTFTLADNDTASDDVNKDSNDTTYSDATTLVTMTGSSEGNPVPSVTKSETNGTTSYTYTGGTLGCAHQTKHNYKLTVTWPVEQNDAKYAGSSDKVTVTVKSEQISPSEN